MMRTTSAAPCPPHSGSERSFMSTWMRFTRPSNSATTRICAAKPVAVGGSRERGVVAAASYEARKFGIRSAMPSITARRQCPDLIFVKPRFDVYREVSLQIRGIFAEHTEVIEPLSLDEAYLDVTENLRDIPLARDIALQIRAAVKAETGLNASAGISYNKFLAKLASDQRKPNGQYVITPEMGPAFVETLPVGKMNSFRSSTRSGSIARATARAGAL
jgi:DNA polymerase IV